MVKYILYSHISNNILCFSVVGSDFSAVLKAVLSSPIGKILKLVPAAHRRDLFKRYLTDFIASTHTSLQKDVHTEFKVIVPRT